MDFTEVRLRCSRSMRGISNMSSTATEHDPAHRRVRVAIRDMRHDSELSALYFAVLTRVDLVSRVCCVSRSCRTSQALREAQACYSELNSVGWWYNISVVVWCSTVLQYLYLLTGAAATASFIMEPTCRILVSPTFTFQLSKGGTNQLSTASESTPSV